VISRYRPNPARLLKGGIILISTLNATASPQFHQKVDALALI